MQQYFHVSSLSHKLINTINNFPHVKKKEKKRWRRKKKENTKPAITVNSVITHFIVE